MWIFITFYLTDDDDGDVEDDDDGDGDDDVVTAHLNNFYYPIF